MNARSHGRTHLFFALFRLCFHGSIPEPNGGEPAFSHSLCPWFRLLPECISLLVSIRLYKEGDETDTVPRRWRGRPGGMAFGEWQQCTLRVCGVLRIWVTWPGMPGVWAGAKVTVSGATALQLSILKCLKMSDILPSPKACCVYTPLLLKSSLVDIRVAEQDRRNHGRPGARWHLGKCLQFCFSDADDYVEVRHFIR